MEKLAIFDVDYTLTKKETLIQLYMFMLKKKPKFIIHTPRSFFAALLYALKFYDEKKAKENFIYFIEGIKEEEMQDIVKEFYERKLSKIIYEDAIKMIRKLKGEGYKVYLISASPEFYLNELYNIKEVDKIIGTRFKCEEGIYRREMVGANCKGKEKVRRLKEELEKENIEVDYKNSYMFSDSLADLPLFELVGNPFLINYKKGHEKIKILNWR